MQKYQVFINEHFICDYDLGKSNPQSVAKLSINNADEEDLQIIAEWLLKEEERAFAVEFKALEGTSLIGILKAKFQYIQAAGGVVFNQNQDLLCIYRLNKWDLPKGKVEERESIEVAALREVEEECGIKNVELGNPLPSTFHIYEHHGKIVFKETFWFKMKVSGEQKLMPQIEENIEEAVWKSKHELEEVLNSTYASLRPLFNSSF